MRALIGGILLLVSFQAFASGPDRVDAPEDAKVLGNYQHLDPNHWVPTDLLETAVTYFDKNKSRFRNQLYISVINFRPRSDEYRFFLVNMQTGEVERFHTSHGNGSVEADPAFAVKFGNVPGSNMTSLGFARTGEVYVGSLQRSLRMDGLSETNSNMRSRAIVIHGSDQMHEANVIQGVSGGCVMFDFAVRDGIIDKIRDGSLIYAGLSPQ